MAGELAVFISIFFRDNEVDEIVATHIVQK